jgi:hypothetical protein
VTMTSPSDPQVRVIDTGGPMLTISLVYPGGVEVSRKVRQDQAEGQKCKDLIAAMRRRAER